MTMPDARAVLVPDGLEGERVDVLRLGRYELKCPGRGQRLHRPEQVGKPDALPLHVVD